MSDTVTDTGAAPVTTTTQPDITSSPSMSQTTPDAAVPTTPTAAPVSWVNPDGTLKEGWKNTLVPEDFRGKRVYDAVGNDVASLLRHIGHQDSVIGKQGKGIFVPGPEASQTEKDIFYKALGRPDKPEEYKIDIPKEAMDETLAVEAKTIFHKAGLTQSQVDAVIALDKARMEASAKDLEDNPVKYFEELLPKVQPIYAKAAEDELRQRWGDAYDARIHLANRAIEENISNAEDKQLILSRAGNDPLVADLLATMMQKYAVSSTGPNTTVGNPTNVAKNLQQRIEDINSQLTPDLKRANRDRYDRLLNEKTRLYEQGFSG